MWLGGGKAWHNYINHQSSSNLEIGVCPSLLQITLAGALDFVAKSMHFFRICIWHMTGNQIEKLLRVKIFKKKQFGSCVELNYHRGGGSHPSCISLYSFVYLFSTHRQVEPANRPHCMSLPSISTRYSSKVRYCSHPLLHFFIFWQCSSKDTCMRERHAGEERLRDRK